MKLSCVEQDVIPVIDPNRQKEIDLPCGSHGWPEGVKFEDAKRVERYTIHRVIPHVVESRSFLGNSSLLCVQSVKW